MAGILKNQVLKHLAKIFKNLSPDQLNLSALKGSCELHNLELNEPILMDLLSLPVWLNLVKANCNHAVIRIQWTNLKKQPVYLGLDEVVVEVETSENFRQSTMQSNFTYQAQQPHKYGFGDRVLDGMTVAINSVIISFKSSAFQASLQLSRMMIESRSPDWRKIPDVRMSRIKDVNRGQLLLFKHIEWQTLRVEAKCVSEALRTPLRLITNQASCRITIKKRLSDCEALGARIMLIFDDLLWVLTDAQLISAFSFVDYIFGLIRKAPVKVSDDRSRTAAGQQQSQQSPHPNLLGPDQRQAQMIHGSIFSKHDVVQTSLHLFTSRIEVHLCDDLDPESTRSSHPKLLSGGALQITLQKLVIDCYPICPVTINKEVESQHRRHWFHYTDPSAERSSWLHQHLQHFVEKIATQNDPNALKPPLRSQVNSVLGKYLARTVIVRVGDYSIGCVSTNTGKHSGTPEKLLTTDKGGFCLPEGVVAFHLETNLYYYYDETTGDNNAIAVPEPTCFIHIAPLKLFVDQISVLWLNAFQVSLQKAMLRLKEIIPSDENLVKVHILIEMLMPQILIPIQHDSKYSALEGKSSKITVTNSFYKQEIWDNLNESMESLGKSSLFYDRSNFPWMKEDLKPVSEKLLKAAEASSKQQNNGNQLWFVKMEPFWAEFKLKNSSKREEFLDPLPVNVWAAALTDVTPAEPAFNLILHIPTPARLQLKKSHYLYLMRLSDELLEFGIQLNRDTAVVSTGNVDDETAFNAFSLVSLIPKAEIFIILNEETQKTRSAATSPVSERRRLSSEAIIPHELSDSENITPLKAPQQVLPRLNASVPKSQSDSLLSGEKPLTTKVNPALSSNEINTDPSIPNPKSPLHRTHHLVPSTPTRNSIQIEYHAHRSNDISQANSTKMDDETMSIRSDFSADSDPYVLVGIENSAPEDDFFAQNDDVVEVADEVKEDTASQFTNDESSSPSSDVPVGLSLVKVELKNIGFVQQSFGYKSTILLRGANLKLAEHFDISYCDFTSLVRQRISLDSSMGEKMPLASIIGEDSSEVSIRVDALNKPSLQRELISLNLKGLTLSTGKDTLTILGDFFVDEEAKVIAPTQIYLQDVNLTLNDDKIPLPPLGIKVAHLLAHRDSKNVLSVLPLNPGLANRIPAKLLDNHKKLKQNPPLSHDITADFNLYPECNGANDNMLDQVLDENEKLTKEVERLRLENEALRNSINS